nr:unnamed protein product [Naegleria fowleri]
MQSFRRAKVSSCVSSDACGHGNVEEEEEDVEEKTERTRSSSDSFGSNSPLLLFSSNSNNNNSPFQPQQPKLKASSEPVEQKLTSALNQLNRKVLEPLLRDLEVAHSVFSEVNVGTKKALKEFVFLKKKEEIERREIERLEEEEMRKQELSARERKHSFGPKNANNGSAAVPLKNSENQIQAQNPIVVDAHSTTTENTPRPSQFPNITPDNQPSKTTVSTNNFKKVLSLPQNVYKKNPTSSNAKQTLKKDTTSRKQLNTKSIPAKTQPQNSMQTASKEPTKKKSDLDNILAMARKIRSYEETKAFENIANKKIEPKEDISHQQQEKDVQEKEQKQVKFCQPLPQQDPVNNVHTTQKSPRLSTPKEKVERKLSFITMSERFEHYADILQRIQQLNEKSEQIGSLFEKKTGWNFYTPKQISKGSTKFAPEIPLVEIYNKTLTSVLSSSQSKSWPSEDVQDFKQRFIFDENEMKNIETTLLQNTKEVRTPELTPTSSVYSDIPNSYIGRWLPKRVDQKIIDLLVPRKSLKYKLDKKRAKYSTPLLYYCKEKDLKHITEQRFNIQHLMLKRFLYGKIFKDFKLLDFLPHIQQQGNDNLYFKLLRALEGIIPCESIRDENRRNIIDWKSMFHFVEKPNYEDDDFFNEFASSLPKDHEKLNSEQEQEIEEDCHAPATVKDYSPTTRTLTPLDHFQSYAVDVNSPSSLDDQQIIIEEQIQRHGHQNQQHDYEEPTNDDVDPFD